MQYRGDIDGLRAVAVLAVMVFHAGLGMTGGYVGVDVFFVISGFLITSIIVKDLDRQTFSLTRFWDRRIRRIWPAATVVTAATVLVAIALMLPVSLKLTAKDALAQLLMVANFRYYVAIDYFAGPAELRPLLHTWSLAVEEQFYILFPPLLIVLWRWLPRYRKHALVGLALVSFGVSIWTLELYSNANFFLLPFRAWELLLGGLLAIHGVAKPGSRHATEAGAWVGMGLIAFSVFAYDGDTPFPGLAAVPPCLGSALIVATPGSSLSRVLETRPLVMIGKMSYSLYLWHWPALAFLRYLYGPDLSTEVALGALLGSFALSWLSWKWVETPFRRARTRSWSMTVFIGASSSALVASLALWVVLADGLPSRFSADVVEFSDPAGVPTTWLPSLPKIIHERADLEGETLVLPIGAPRSADTERRPDFLLWGDSHAMAISELVDTRAAELDLGGYAALRSGTRPFPGAVRPAAPRGRDLWNEAVLDWIAERRPRVIVLCARWSIDLEGLPDGSLDTLIAPAGSSVASPESAKAATRQALTRLVAAAKSADARISFLLEVPHQERGPEEMAIASILADEALPEWGTSLVDHERSQRSLLRILETFSPEDLHVIDLASGMMGSDGRTRVRFGSQAIYWDDDHLSPAGAEEVLSGLIGDALMPATLPPREER